MLTMAVFVVVFAAGCDNWSGQPNPKNKFVRPSDVKSFDELFAKNCVACHGVDGTFGAGPPLNDPIFLAIVPDEVLLMTIAEGRQGTEMPAFLVKNGGTLTSEQVKILATGLRTKWGQKKPAGEFPDYESEGKGDAVRGKDVFAQACAGCHGPDGRAEKLTINDRPFLALSSDQVIRRIIITGRPDLGMPDCTVIGGKARPNLKAPLTTADVDDVMAFIGTWRKQATDR